MYLGKVHPVLLQCFQWQNWFLLSCRTIVLISNLGSGREEQRPFSSPKWRAAFVKCLSISGDSVKSVGGRLERSLNGIILLYAIDSELYLCFGIKSEKYWAIQHNF